MKKIILLVFALLFGAPAFAQQGSAVQPPCGNMDCTVLSLNLTGATVPANGIYLGAANTLSISTNTTPRFSIGSAGISADASGGPRITSAASTSTVPSLIPYRSATTTGIGGDGTNLYGIVAGATIETISSTGVSITGTLSTSSHITMGISSQLSASGASILSAQGINGRWRMANNAGTGFTELLLGPSGTAYPQLRPSGTAGLLAFRLADNSADAPITVASIALSGGTTLSSFVEGSWTPTLSGSGGGSATYTAQSGLYSKIGKTVIAIGNITVNVNSILGNVRIDSLPYTSSTSGASGSCTISLYTGFTFVGYTQMIAFVNANTTRAPLQTVGTAVANAALPTAGMANGAIIYFNCTYQTD